MSYKILIKDVPHFNFKKTLENGGEDGGRETEEAGLIEKHFPRPGFHVSTRLQDTFNQIFQLIENTRQLLPRDSTDCVLSLLRQAPRNSFPRRAHHDHQAGVHGTG